MAVRIPFITSQRELHKVVALAVPREFGELLDDLFVGDKEIVSLAALQLCDLLTEGNVSLRSLNRDEWEKLLFPVKYSEDAIVSKLFGADLQVAILRALAFGKHEQGEVCARFASYRACNRKVRKAARLCLAELEGYRKNSSAGLLRAA